MIKIIAEAGINHNGFLHQALQLVDAAQAAGANVVKFQIYHTDRLVRDVPNRELLKSCELPPDEHRVIADYCKAVGIEWMASCFDTEAVDVACDLGAKTIKIGSGEIVHHELLRQVAARGKSLMLSTGASTMHEVHVALDAYGYAWGEDGLELLHCVSAYPASLEDCNLRAIAALRGQFGCPVGFSDHTIGFDAAVAAVAAGAEIIEKHLMFGSGCPDEAVSLSPHEFAGYVNAIRRAEAMMGDGVKRPTPAELKMRDAIRYRWHHALPTDSTARREASQTGQGHPDGGTACPR